MIQSKIMADEPTIKGVIQTSMPRIIGRIENNKAVVTGVIHSEAPVIFGKIIKNVDHDPEPYYEVANEHGITIVIGD